MDIGSIALAFAGAQTAKLQMAAAAAMMRMNAQAGASIVEVIEKAQDNLQNLANVAAGVGGNLDISV
ncbi:MAG: hypothetical protein HXY30_18965 [Pseudorhodoplanes sp.]|nr:hypothetical protein [Pseudorhodoplanes sp.]